MMDTPERVPLRTEIVAGVTTFFTMAYIVVVNPAILSTAGTGMPFSGVLTATVLVCATMTLLMGLFGSSPGTAYVESIAGVRAGGRTGRTAMVTGLCFLPCLFIAPLAAAVPPYATAAVLIIVGVSMFQTVTAIDFEHLETAVPAFATLILIPLTFSITQGILWGFILHVVLHVTAGRARELSRTILALALISVALLVLEHMS